ncbi:MAG: ATP-binding protein/SpoIIE family protein phosphatase [Flavipsychrobacter sp.]|nr:ATP-binding protein/SpoIIE family protein phosphatase [Flavipsychrobacter sp.]
MDSTSHTSYNAEDRSYFAILKKEIHQVATAAGFSDKKTGEIDIIVAEMASNLIKHAGGGEILVRLMQENGNEAIELISIDNGPGMADPLRMLEDGVSTANTLGHGLGAMKRLSDTFQIYSLKEWGTIVLARVYKNELPLFIKKPLVEVRWVVVPKPGETVSGDGAYHQLNAEGLKVFLGDGLGHGPDAHLAVQQAISAIGICTENSPIDILRYLHTAVKKTRGLVGTMAIYNFKEKNWRICGIGNIATRTQNFMSFKNYMSYNGIIGMNIPNTLKEQEVADERGQVLIMCSDGIKTRMELQKYTGIFKYDLTILAAAIYKDFARKTDDMSVMVSRINTTA